MKQGSRIDVFRFREVRVDFDYQSSGQLQLYCYQLLKVTNEQNEDALNLHPLNSSS